MNYMKFLLMLEIFTDAITYYLKYKGVKDITYGSRTKTL